MNDEVMFLSWQTVSVYVNYDFMSASKSPLYLICFSYNADKSEWITLLFVIGRRERLNYEESNHVLNVHIRRQKLKRLLHCEPL